MTVVGERVQCSCTFYVFLLSLCILLLMKVSVTNKKNGDAKRLHTRLKEGFSPTQDRDRERCSLISFEKHYNYNLYVNRQQSCFSIRDYPF